MLITCTNKATEMFSEELTFQVMQCSVDAFHEFRITMQLYYTHGINCVKAVNLNKNRVKAKKLK